MEKILKEIEKRFNLIFLQKYQQFLQEIEGELSSLFVPVKEKTVQPEIEEIDQYFFEDQDPEIKNLVDLYLSEIKRVKFFSPEEERKLFQQVEKGDQRAREKIIESVLPFVVFIAKRYTNHPYHNLEFADLIQEGNLGLIKAIEKFDWRKGFRFISYAGYWIRQKICRAIENEGRLIRLPVHFQKEVKEYLEASDQLQAELGRTPLRKEIAQRLKISEEKVGLIEGALSPTVSLDLSIGENKDKSLIDFIADPGQNPEEQVTEKDYQESMAKALNEALEKSRLSEKEKLVIKLRFGLDGGRLQTYQKVGDRLKLSRERIRQIEKKAIRKLRRDPNFRKLRKFLK
jgi:RNA polymerase primary sigma factor